jgi:hypothetical protein
VTSTSRQSPSKLIPKLSLNLNFVTKNFPSASVEGNTEYKKVKNIYHLAFQGTT